MLPVYRFDLCELLESNETIFGDRQDWDDSELEANEGEQAAETTDGGPADIIEVDAANCTAENQETSSKSLDPAVFWA